MTELWERDAWDLADAVRAGELSAVDLLDTSLERIAKHNSELNAVCHLDEIGARSQAEAIDAVVASGGDPGPFAGVPIGVKELAQAKGFPNTHASLVYRDEIARNDCPEVARLRGAGAVIAALTTAPEFGIPSYTASRLHGVTRSPWNPEATPGGSSGGSAAAVSAGMFSACTGSDGGGSIRIPSSYSGLPGMKVTFGRIPSGGEDDPFDTGLTSVSGPIVRSVRDAARYIDVAGGPSLTDSTSLPKAQDYEPLVADLDRARELLRGRKVAFTTTLGYADTDTEVAAVVREAAEALIDAAGLQLIHIEIKFPRPGRAWSVLSAGDMAAWRLERCTEQAEELDQLARGSIEAMPHLRARHLGDAVRRRHELLVASAQVFEEVDLLLTPTTPTTAYVAEGTMHGEVNGIDVDLMMLSAPFTAPFNMTGQPAMSLPAGLVDQMPCGLQVVARRLSDELCLAAGAVFEAARPWPKFAPSA
ncbi:MAG: amidase [Acidimicrobiia bacterium]|nr:amidase [Acidimicrobiia bacterium]